MNDWPARLAAVEPRQFATWMRSHGWRLVERREGRSARWLKAAAPHQGDGEFELELPLNPSVRDYARRVAEVLQRSEGYARAIQAHRDGAFLRCEGELAQVGRRFQLRQVRHVEVLPDEE